MRNIIFIVILAFVSGCGSRKKEVHKEKSGSSYELVADTTAQVTLKSETITAEDSISHINVANLTIEYEGTEGDSITVEQYGPDGRMQAKTIIKGKGKAKLEESSGTAGTSKKSISTAIAESETVASSKRNIAAHAYSETLDKHIESTGPGFWFWFWAAIIIILILLFWFFRKKLKSL